MIPAPGPNVHQAPVNQVSVNPVLNPVIPAQVNDDQGNSDSDRESPAREVLTDLEFRESN
jgi:hypothetical protein